ncbi:hypothetical protein DTO271G3_8651 [Paecilomyces variotii]|nr:hypothetical protein DTO271G3_8651 [Paecilomyces variotii]
MRLIHVAVNLLPLLKNASVFRRFLSVFDAALDGKVVIDDMDGRKSSQLSHRGTFASTCNGPAVGRGASGFLIC